MSVQSVLSSPQAFARLFGTTPAAQERLARKLDANGDGGLNLDELSGLLGADPGKKGQEVFAALDSDADGKLGMRELQSSQLFSPASLDVLLGQQSGDGFAGWVMSETDADGDGVLTSDEFRTLGPDGGRGPARGRFDPDGAFAAGDSDGDGRLSLDELSHLTGPSHAGIVQPLNPTATADDLMTRDADGSGGLSKSELADFSNIDLDSVFELVDGDKDGEISKTEFDAQIAKQPEFYSSGLMRLATPNGEVIEGHARRLPEGYSLGGSVSAPAPIPAGEQALHRLFRENLSRLTDQLIERVANPREA